MPARYVLNSTLLTCSQRETIGPIVGQNREVLASLAIEFFKLTYFLTEEVAIHSVYFIYFFNLFINHLQQNIKNIL